jgi:hypothetical protein
MEPTEELPRIFIVSSLYEGKYEPDVAFTSAVGATMYAEAHGEDDNGEPRAIVSSVVLVTG